MEKMPFIRILSLLLLAASLVLLSVSALCLKENCPSGSLSQGSGLLVASALHYKLFSELNSLF